MPIIRLGWVHPHGIAKLFTHSACFEAICVFILYLYLLKLEGSHEYITKGLKEVVLGLKFIS